MTAADEYYADKACEICGSPARSAIADLWEAEPVEDGGTFYQTSKLAATHFLCLEHKREPLFVELPSHHWSRTAEGLQVKRAELAAKG